jgi:hypothetical protein
MCTCTDHPYVAVIRDLGDHMVGIKVPQVHGVPQDSEESLRWVFDYFMARDLRLRLVIAMLAEEKP